jgi:hypothetical protein
MSVPAITVCRIGNGVSNLLIWIGRCSPIPRLLSLALHQISHAPQASAVRVKNKLDCGLFSLCMLMTLRPNLVPKPVNWTTGTGQAERCEVVHTGRYEANAHMRPLGSDTEEWLLVEIVEVKLFSAPGERKQSRYWVRRPSGDQLPRRTTRQNRIAAQPSDQYSRFFSLSQTSLRNNTRLSRHIS